MPSEDQQQSADQQALLTTLRCLGLGSPVELECPEADLTVEGVVQSVKAWDHDRGEVRYVSVRTDDLPEKFSFARVDLNEGRDDQDFPEVELVGIGYNENDDQFQRPLGEVTDLRLIAPNQTDDDSKLIRCEVCDDPTTESPLQVKASPANAQNGGSAVQLRACKECQHRLFGEIKARFENGRV